MDTSTMAASLVWTGGGAPHVLAGTITGHDGDLYRFAPRPGDLPATGEKVILWLETSERLKLMGVIEGSSPDGIVVRTRRDQPQLRRYYPRVDTSVALVYRVIDLGSAASQYSKRQTAVLKSWWRPSSQAVNLSADGLAFLSEVAVPVGARLGIKLRFPDDPGVDHAVTGDVVRAAPEQGPDGEEHHRLVVQLSWMSPETHAAFIDYIRHWQDDALEALEPRTPDR